MTEKHINLLNIFLMVFSAALAIAFPFELFLFSFFVLGALHYLTEISWLEKKQFFIKSKMQILALILLVISIGIYHFYTQPWFIDTLNIMLSVLVVLAISLALTNKVWIHIISVCIGFFAVYGLKLYQTEAYLVIFSVFLPSIIHITIFTFVFILSGVQKERSLTGILSLVTFVVLSFMYFFIPTHTLAFSVTPFAKDLYFEFIVLNKKMSDFFGYGSINNLEEIYFSATGKTIMQYIAFSYTYHFLNWFSKTSIIKWHEVSKVRLASVFGLYFLILGLCYFNFKLGISLLTILGVLHVYLELPLNFISFERIFNPLILKLKK